MSFCSFFLIFFEAKKRVDETVNLTDEKKNKNQGTFLILVSLYSMDQYLT